MDPCPAEIDLERLTMGEITAEQRARIEAHAGQCPTCAARLADRAADASLLEDVKRALDRRRSAQCVPALGATVGGYRLLHEIGRGGMGVVFEAEQQSPRRRVALKVIGPGLVSRRALKRFDHEAEVLGRLQHPGIAQIREAGAEQTPDGRMPWFAMELVHGRPLLEHAASAALDVEQRLRLLVLICDAVQHAHAKGVIHRDLKPQNVLVDEAGRPKVLDFGVARLVERGAESDGCVTRAEEIVGTLAYISPEQLGGRPDDVDARSDVWSLGVMLFELLTGELPYDVRGRPVTEAVRLLADGEPRALATVDRRLRGDLDTIAAKALARDRDRRYASASELARDVERFLGHEPIAARRGTAVYHLRKLAARHRALVVAFLLVVLASLAGAIGIVVQADRARAAERAARTSAATWQRVSAFLQSLLRQGDPVLQEGPDPTLRDVLRAASRDVTTELDEKRDGDAEVAAHVHLALGRAFCGVRALDDAARHLEAAARLGTRLFGAGHPFLGGVHALRANLVAGRDDAQAERELRRALAIFERNPATEGLAIAETTSRLASVLLVLGRREEARAAALRAATLAEALPEGDRARVLVPALLRLCRISSRDGQMAAAVEAAGRALALARDKLGADDVRVALCHLGMGEALRLDPARFAEAEEHVQEAVRIQRLRYGEGSLPEANSLYVLGRLALDQGRGARAAKILERVLATQEKGLGGQSMAVAATAAVLGRAQMAAHRFADAEASLRRACAIAAAQPAVEHDRMQYELWLGQLLCYTDPIEAEERLGACLAGADKAMAGDTAYRHRARTALGFALARQGRTEEGERILLAAWASIEGSLGPGHLVAKEAAQMLHDVYLATGDADEARLWLARATQPDR